MEKLPPPPASYTAWQTVACKKCNCTDGGPLCSNQVCARCWRARAERLAATQTDLVTVIFPF